VLFHTGVILDVALESHRTAHHSPDAHARDDSFDSPMPSAAELEVREVPLPRSFSLAHRTGEGDVEARHASRTGGGAGRPRFDWWGVCLQTWGVKNQRDVWGQSHPQVATDSVHCSNCKRAVQAGRYAPHLEKCLGKVRDSLSINETLAFIHVVLKRRLSLRRVGEPWSRKANSLLSGACSLRCAHEQAMARVRRQAAREWC